MQPVWRTESEVSWHRECEGADTSYVVVSLYLCRYLGCTPELTVWLGWSEHHGKICMCPESSVLRYAGIFARPSVFVLTDKVLLHSGHLYDDSCIASGPYAKYKSMNIMDMLCYGLRGLAVGILFSSVLSATNLTIFRPFSGCIGAPHRCFSVRHILGVHLTPHIQEKCHDHSEFDFTNITCKEQTQMLVSCK